MMWKVVVILCISLAGSTYGCNFMKMTNCIQRAMSAFSSKTGSSFDYTKEEIQQKCGNLKEAQDCLDTTLTECLSQLPGSFDKDHYESALDSFAPLCKNAELMAKYAEHAKCIKEQTAEFKSCYNTEIKLDDASDTAAVKEACCKFYDQVGCSSKVIKDKCGDDAGEFASQYFEQIADSEITEKCAPHKAECSNSAINMASLVLIMTSLLVTMLIKK